jgi:hypothetical protein
VNTEPKQLRILEQWIDELSGQVRKEPELPSIGSQVQRKPDANQDCQSALTDLVIELLRTGVLAEDKGRVILEKLRR